MRIPQHFFTFDEWPGPEMLVEFAEKQTGYVRDGEGASGLWYASGQDGWDRSQPNPIPDGMLRIAWSAIKVEEQDTEIVISEQEYLEALRDHLARLRLGALVERVSALLRAA